MFCMFSLHLDWNLYVPVIADIKFVNINEERLVQKGIVEMVILWLLSIILSTICTVSGEESDENCFDNCSCCKEQICELQFGWPNVCTIGCIDGHRGARCYELCQDPNCKSCGFIESDKSCTACYDGYYLGSNKDCSPQCPSNCKSCTSSTMCTECKDGFYNKDGSTVCKYAHCPGNCECNGQGDCISCKRGYYDTSTSCTKQCPVNCLACESGEFCSECKHGFYNGYKYDKTINLQLDNCTYACRDNCTQCQSYNKCLQCKDGKYGQTCQDICSIGCNDISCSFDSGQCTCTKDFTGDKCMKCVDGKYGLLCNGTCSKYCKDKICERTSGNCTAGCINDNISGATCNTCTVGMFGELCDNICPDNCKDIRCERYSGTCSDGCTRNYNGTRCDICIHGKYGRHCEANCSVHCAGNVCEKDYGTCFECDENFQGEKCDECYSGYYGANCDSPCSPYCSNSSCNTKNGTCVDGCKNGYSGDKCCVMSENCVECDTNTACKTCVPGFFKTLCNETCDGCDGACHISTGECIPIKGDVRTTVPVATAAVLGSVLTLSLAAIIVILVLFLLKKIKNSRRQHSQTKREPIYENQLQNVGEQFPRTTHDATDTINSGDVERNVYEGIRRVNEEEHEYQQLSYNTTVL